MIYVKQKSYFQDTHILTEFYQNLGFKKGIR